MSRLLIIGAGGHGRVVAEAANLSGKWKRIAFLDDAYPGLAETEYGHVLGKIGLLSEISKEFSEAIAAVGDNSLRLKITRMLAVVGLPPAVVIHPSAVVSKFARIGIGTAILAQSHIGVGAIVGSACIINNCASVDHDCRIGDAVHIAPGAHLSGGVSVGDMTLVGIGAVAVQYIAIGSRVTIGAGAVATANLPENGIFVGSPAKQVRSNPDRQPPPGSGQ